MTAYTLSHKIRLDPTCKQIEYFTKACGIARFAWNWALAKWKEKYDEGKSTNGLALKKEFNSLKVTEFPWIYEVTKYASQQPFLYLQKAFANFFKKQAKYPKFKKKGVHDSFYIGGDQIQIVGKRVRIPALGWVRLTESLRFVGKINGVTISRRAGFWFISFNVVINQRPALCESQAVVGVDMGIKTLATLSNGLTFPNHKPLQKKLGRLKRLQRSLSRKKQGSQNRNKAKIKVAKLHYQIACTRNDNLHKLTTHLTANYGKIAIEDLNIRKMVQNKRLSRAISDSGWHELSRQLKYKAELKGCKIFVADQWFASSKKCSSCGTVKSELALSERIYKCSTCQLELDRDLNAAKCLEQLINTVSYTGIDACGQDGSVIVLKQSQPAWKKQELSHV